MPLKDLADRRNVLHRKSDAQTVLRHALTDVQIGKVALVSSCGAESVVLLHMAAQIDVATPVIFLDTEMLFPETLTYQRDVAEHLGLTNVSAVSPDRNDLLTHDVDGLLHQADTDACCDLRKTQPLEKALRGFDGWITGRKQYHGGQRTALPLFEKQGRKIKINPLTRWSPADLNAYIADHHLPPHPLVARGFGSVGCMPCTTRSSAHEDPRAGRWRDSAKSECGIHVASRQSTTSAAPAE
jgi:phosphoadenosine phosphosulfate reductase